MERIEIDGLEIAYRRASEVHLLSFCTAAPWTLEGGAARSKSTAVVDASFEKIRSAVEERAAAPSPMS